MGLLSEIEAYYDAVPRSAARVEHIGPFTLFVKVGEGWPYYSRPTLGATHFQATDVERVRRRQRALSIPETFEWVAETTPTLGAAAEAAGLEVTRHPLMVLDGDGDPLPRTEPADQLEIRLVGVDDDLALFGAVAPVAFSAPGTAIGPAGIDSVRSIAQAAETPATDFRRARLRVGQTVMAVALADGQPVGVGSHQPVGTTTELTGIGVVPAYRRRGVGAALTAYLVASAVADGLRTIFLSAGNDAIARIYARVGFRTVATACIGQPTPIDH